jgi:hypothetical protein
MTNRIDYQITEYQFTKEEEVEMIRKHLVKMHRAVTLDNARIVLALLESEAPGEWGLTMDDLAELWPGDEVPFLGEPAYPRQPIITESEMYF